MLAFISRRIGYSLLILLGVTFITYLLLFMLPADPARQIAGRSATPEVVAGIRAQLGLDLPFYRQYANYLGNLVQGDLGRSYIQRSPVTELIGSRLRPSLELMAAGIGFELLIGISLGVRSSLRLNGLANN